MDDKTRKYIVMILLAMFLYVGSYLSFSTKTTFHVFDPNRSFTETICHVRYCPYDWMTAFFQPLSSVETKLIRQTVKLEAENS
jgi:hypothetical protein